MDVPSVNALKNWFRNSKRPLPWRNEPTPYGVWVSEVMLQQTQVSVVIPYYLRWMEHFPTIEALARAPEELVLKLWEGLGYYSRVRRLHRGAQQVINIYGGSLPSDAASLSQISGLGPYTIGAIRSFAFHCKAAAVDGNVLRVLARYYAIHEEIDRPAIINNLRQKAKALLPDEEPWIVAEGLIELGATLCNKKPLCDHCPLRPTCASHQGGLTAQLPKKQQKASSQQLHRLVAVLKCKESLLLRKVPEGKLMGGLWEFPYLEVNAVPSSDEELLKWLENAFGLSHLEAYPLKCEKHSFTRYKALLYPYLFHCDLFPTPTDYQWCDANALKHCSFPSGHRAVLQQLQFLHNILI